MWKCTYIETSAKANFNIESVFQEILTLEQKRLLYLQAEEEKVRCDKQTKTHSTMNAFQDKKHKKKCSIL